MIDVNGSNIRHPLVETGVNIFIIGVICFFISFMGSVALDIFVTREKKVHV